MDVHKLNACRRCKAALVNDGNVLNGLGTLKALRVGLRKGDDGADGIEAGDELCGVVLADINDDIVLYDLAVNRQ